MKFFGLVAALRPICHYHSSQYLRNANRFTIREVKNHYGNKARRLSTLQDRSILLTASLLYMVKCVNKINYYQVEVIYNIVAVLHLKSIAYICNLYFEIYQFRIGVLQGMATSQITIAMLLELEKMIIQESHTGASVSSYQECLFHLFLNNVIRFLNEEEYKRVPTRYLLRRCRFLLKLVFYQVLV